MAFRLKNTLTQLAMKNIRFLALAIVAMLSVTLTACDDDLGGENPGTGSANSEAIDYCVGIFEKYLWRSTFGTSADRENGTYLEWLMVFNSANEGHLTTISWVEGEIDTQEETDFVYEIKKASVYDGAYGGSGTIYGDAFGDAGGREDATYMIMFMLDVLNIYVGYWHEDPGYSFYAVSERTDRR